jgi:hypothetical protein
MTDFHKSLESTAAARDATLQEISEGFVSPSKANRAIYVIILEALWPSGTALPGPVLTASDLRAAINDYRSRIGKDPYQDPFRRLRELQGEEGLLGIEKIGGSYQMRTADVSPKRHPRRSFSAEEIEEVRARTDGKCAVCGKNEGNLSPDHRVPRVRGGGDGLANIQMLCQSCNIFKSVACRGCAETCETCPWCDPASYPLVMIQGDLLERLAARARKSRASAQNIAETGVSSYLDALEQGPV